MAHLIPTTVAGASRSTIPHREGRIRAQVLACSSGAEGVKPKCDGAFGRDYPLEITSYQTKTCESGTYIPKNKGYTCLDVKGRAKITGKDIEAADVFGFLVDADNNSALAVNPDGTTRTVVAGINKPLQGGGRMQEVEFTLVVSEAALANPPLTFKGFKLNPSVSIVEDRFRPFTGCDLDPSADGCT